MQVSCRRLRRNIISDANYTESKGKLLKMRVDLIKDDEQVLIDIECCLCCRDAKLKVLSLLPCSKNKFKI